MPLSDLIRNNVITAKLASGMERIAIEVKRTEVAGTGGTQRTELEGMTKTVDASSRGFGDARAEELLAERTVDL